MTTTEPMLQRRRLWVPACTGTTRSVDPIITNVPRPPVLAGARREDGHHGRIRGAGHGHGGARRGAGRRPGGDAAIAAGPAYVFLALDHDVPFIATSALASLAVNAVTAIFALTYAAA